jgi:hypothetical protein
MQGTAASRARAAGNSSANAHKRGASESGTASGSRVEGSKGLSKVTLSKPQSKVTLSKTNVEKASPAQHSAPEEASHPSDHNETSRATSGDQGLTPAKGEAAASDQTGPVGLSPIGRIGLAGAREKHVGGPGKVQAVGSRLKKGTVVLDQPLSKGEGMGEGKCVRDIKGHRGDEEGGKSVALEGYQKEAGKKREPELAGQAEPTPEEERVDQAAGVSGGEQGNEAEGVPTAGANGAMPVRETESTAALSEAKLKDGTLGEEAVSRNEVEEGRREIAELPDLP